MTTLTYDQITSAGLNPIVTFNTLASGLSTLKSNTAQEALDTMLVNEFLMNTTFLGLIEAQVKAEQQMRSNNNQPEYNPEPQLVDVN